MKFQRTYIPIQSAVDSGANLITFHAYDAKLYNGLYSFIPVALHVFDIVARTFTVYPLDVAMSGQYNNNANLGKYLAGLNKETVNLSAKSALPFSVANTLSVIIADAEDKSQTLYSFGDNNSVLLECYTNTPESISIDGYNSYASGSPEQKAITFDANGRMPVYDNTQAQIKDVNIKQVNSNNLFGSKIQVDTGVVMVDIEQVNMEWISDGAKVPVTLSSNYMNPSEVMNVNVVQETPTNATPVKVIIDPGADAGGGTGGEIVIDYFQKN